MAGMGGPLACDPLAESLSLIHGCPKAATQPNQGCTELTEWTLCLPSTPACLR